MIGLGLACAALGCPAPLGGWDVERLLFERPEIAALEDQQLGDLSPYPFLLDAPDSGAEPKGPPSGHATAASPRKREIGLLACRWSSTQPVVVRLRLEDDYAVWARRAANSLAMGNPGIRFQIEDSESRADEKLSEGVIHVSETGEVGGRGPRGIGDTSVICDVRTDAADRPGERGTLVRAEIRMRSRIRNQLGENVAVMAEEWTGAFMHELGHALGFQGHVRRGQSILVLDQDRLRRAGRLALAGEPWRDDTLEALYRLKHGQRLGRRSLSVQSRRWLARIERSLGPNATNPVARVGDRHGQLEWRTSGGDVLKLHFPFWSRQLRYGEELVGVPDAATRAHLSPGSNHGERQGDSS